MVETAETMLEQAATSAIARSLAVVAGTRTKSGSTNFLRLQCDG